MDFPSQANILSSSSCWKNGSPGMEEPIKGKHKMIPYKETINQVKATSNLPEQPGAELKKLTDKDLSTGWHTNWSTGIANPRMEISCL